MAITNCQTWFDINIEHGLHEVETKFALIPTFCVKVKKFQCEMIHDFGDNFDTYARNIDLSEYWYSISAAGYSQIGFRLLLKWLELDKTWKLTSRAQSNSQSKVTPKYSHMYVHQG